MFLSFFVAFVYAYVYVYVYALPILTNLSQSLSHTHTHTYDNIYTHMYAQVDSSSKDVDTTSNLTFQIYNQLMKAFKSEGKHLVAAGVYMYMCVSLHAYACIFSHTNSISLSLLLQHLTLSFQCCLIG